MNFRFLEFLSFGVKTGLLSFQLLFMILLHSFDHIIAFGNIKPALSNPKMKIKDLTISNNTKIAYKMTVKVVLLDPKIHGSVSTAQVMLQENLYHQFEGAQTLKQQRN